MRYRPGSSVHLMRIRIGSAGIVARATRDILGRSARTRFPPAASPRGTAHTRSVRDAIRVVLMLAALFPVLGGASDSTGISDGIVTRTDVVTNVNREVLETRLGMTTGLGSILDKLVVTVVTAGPNPGTTSLIGASINGSTLFNGGANPAFANVVASGSIFSLGGGCRRGSMIDFPFINANRPRIARYNPDTGQYIVVTPSIAGTDLYDSIDCVVSTLGTIFATTNRTLDRVEIYRDSGGGFVPVQLTGINNIATPFSGGVRPAIAVDSQDDLYVLFQRALGANEFVSVDLATGTVGAPCTFFPATAPTGFTRPRETMLDIYPRGPGGALIAAGDFDDNGSTDIITVPLGSCTPTVTSAGAGSSNGGNGYNWTGYASGPELAEIANNILWGGYWYVRSGNAIAEASPIVSPFVGRGGPFHGCGVENRDSGLSLLAVGAGANTQTLQFSLLLPGLALNNPSLVLRTSFEDQLILEPNAFATCP